jgi:hypothetical protein
LCCARQRPTSEISPPIHSSGHTCASFSDESSFRRSWSGQSYLDQSRQKAIKRVAQQKVLVLALSTDCRNFGHRNRRLVGGSTASWYRLRYARTWRNLCGSPRHGETIQMDDQTCLLLYDCRRAGSRNNCGRLACFPRRSRIKQWPQAWPASEYSLDLGIFCWCSAFLEARCQQSAISSSR